MRSAYGTDELSAATPLATPKELMTTGPIASVSISRKRSGLWTFAYGWKPARHEMPAPESARRKRRTANSLQRAAALRAPLGDLVEVCTREPLEMVK
jgi:hypothetical protein